jgi:hypothetical protein
MLAVGADRAQRGVNFLCKHIASTPLDFSLPTSKIPAPQSSSSRTNGRGWRVGRVMQAAHVDRRRRCDFYLFFFLGILGRPSRSSRPEVNSHAGFSCVPVVVVSRPGRPPRGGVVRGLTGFDGARLARVRCVRLDFEICCWRNHGARLGRTGGRPRRDPLPWRIGRVAREPTTRAKATLP